MKEGLCAIGMQRSSQDQVVETNALLSNHLYSESREQLPHGLALFGILGRETVSKK